MAVRTRRELELEVEFLRKRRLVDGTTGVLSQFIRWAGLVGCSYFGIARPFEALAGRATAADIAVQVKANLAAGDWSTWGLVLPWMVAIGSVVYGLLQRKLRRDAIEGRQARIQALEKAQDPGRTSSTLTTRGDTRREDRL